MTFQFKYHGEGGPVRICRYEFQHAYIVLRQPPPRFANIGNSNKSVNGEFYQKEATQF
jgi:hypothetical protein